MKKLVLMFSLMSLSFVGFNQTQERVTIVKGTSIDFKIEKFISNSIDTAIYFYYGYQNMEYKTITDIGSIIIYKQSDLQNFVDALRTLAEKEEGLNIVVSIPNKANLRVYDFSQKTIWLTDKNGKFTTFSKKQALKIADEIEQYIQLLKK
jgi:hypothetical protein